MDGNDMWAVIVVGLVVWGLVSGGVWFVNQITGQNDYTADDCAEGLAIEYCHNFNLSFSTIQYDRFFCNLGFDRSSGYQTEVFHFSKNELAMCDRLGRER